MFYWTKSPIVQIKPINYTKKKFDILKTIKNILKLMAYLIDTYDMQ